MSQSQQLKSPSDSEPIFMRDEIDEMLQRTEERLAEQRRLAMEGNDFNARMQAASEVDELVEARENLARYRARL